MASDPENLTTAIWALTPGGAALAQKISGALPENTVFIPTRMGGDAPGVVAFNRFGNAVRKEFNYFDHHLFIMAAGIVVRTIAPLLVHKTKDPAVVVMDEKGAFAVSLVSGHIGGANQFAAKAAKISGGQPVITTATDVNSVAAIDLIAVKKNLYIENPDAIKHVNMALIEKQPLFAHDPYGFLEGELPSDLLITKKGPGNFSGRRHLFHEGGAGIYVDDIDVDLPPGVLVLRPLILAAGIGCNRNTGVDEIHQLLLDVLEQFRLSLKSIKVIASVDLKADEKGILELVETLEVPFKVFSRGELNSVKTIPTPSEVVEKHIGVKSVCEAAAILATGSGHLVVPKHKTKNVTVAIARDAFLS